MEETFERERIEQKIKEIEETLTKKEEEKKEEEIFDIEELTEFGTDILSLPFTYLAQIKKKPEIEITPEEREILKRTVKPVIMKYKNLFLFKWPELILVVTYLSIWGKRIEYLRERK